MRTMAALILICLAGFTGTALAADAVTAADPSMSELAKTIFEAVMHGQWWAAAAYGVILAMIGARKLMPASWTTGVKGDIIGTATAFLMAFAGAVATVTMAPGATMTAAVALTALKVGIGAIGGYTAIHKLLGWLAAWDKMPAWAMSALRLLAMLIGSNAIKQAEAAGQAAVEAKPSTGLAGDTKITEVE
jgi:ABC-type arginine transport system permease subunit